MYPGPNEWFIAEFVSLTKWCSQERSWGRNGGC